MIITPIIIGVINPVTTSVTYKYVLGPVPKAVETAAKQYVSGNKSGASILKSYYGELWIEYFTPVNPYGNKLKSTEVREHVSDIFDDFVIGGGDELFDINIKREERGTNTHASSIVTDMAIVDEDTIMDVRYKCQHICEIPIYRQHLMYYYMSEGPYLPYKVLFNGISLPINALELTQQYTPSYKLDMEFELHHKDLQIIAIDHLTTILDGSLRINQICIIDMFSIVTPRSDGISIILQDSYQFDRFYYGFIIKYWPIMGLNLAQDVFHGMDDRELEKLWPTLIMPDSYITSQMNLFYIKNSWKPLTSQYTSYIKSATIVIKSENINTKFALRQLFDNIILDQQYICMMLSLLIDPSSVMNLTDKMVKSITKGYIPLNVCKIYNTGYQPHIYGHIEKFMSTGTPKNSIKLGYYSNNILHEFVLLENGNINFSMTWNDFEKVQFETVYKEIMSIGSDLVDKINKLGYNAFINGNFQAINTEITNMTVTVNWPYSVSNASYKSIISSMREHESSGILQFKSLQQYISTFMYFKKGIIKYSQDYDEIKINNYNRFYDSIIMSRFNNYYTGRLIKFTHRTSDILIDIEGIHSMFEYNLIYGYIFSYLDHIRADIKIENTTSLLMQELGKPQSTQGSKRLKKLQETDPVLYDLRRHNKSNVVYSVLCQSNRQPHIYSEKEVELLSKSMRKRVVKYWNFTEHAPAYYLCPNDIYPILSLKSDIHPNGYCLPCCKKSLPQKNSKYYAMQSLCMQLVSNLASGKSTSNADTSVKSIEILSRHVLSWGKRVDASRVSNLEKNMEQLFANAVASPFELKIIGVNQSTTNVPDAGFAIALAYAVANDDQTINSVFRELAEFAGTLGKSYYAVGDVAGIGFKDAKDLEMGILNAFVSSETILTPFSPGGALYKQYENVLVELVRLLYGYECVIFREHTDGNISLEISNDAKINIMNKKNVTIFMIMVAQSGTYPIAAIDHKFYLRLEVEMRWEIERKLFDNMHHPDDFIKDKVIDLIKSLIKYKLHNIQKDIVSIEKILTTKLSYHINARLVNLNNKCYGLYISKTGRDSDEFYIPIPENEYPNDDIALSFKLRDRSKLASRSEIEHILDAMAISTRSNVSYEDKVIGIYDQQLLWYHTPISHMTDSIIFPYDTYEIDSIIYNIRGIPIEDAHVKSIAASARWMNNLYKFYVAKFVNIAETDRNVKLRAEIKRIIMSTKFNISSDVLTFKHEITQLLETSAKKSAEFDMNKFKVIIQDAYKSHDDVGKYILDRFNETNFEFDMTTMNDIRDMTIAAAAAKIKDIMRKHCVISEKKIEYNDNLFTGSGELSIPDKEFNEYAYLLSDDIHDHNMFELVSIFHGGIFDYYKFNVHPGEHIVFID